MRRLARGSLVVFACLAAASHPAPASPASEEAVAWLKGYLRIDTSNPPGREAAGAAYLQDLLNREGIPTRLIVSPDGRPSLYARLKAESPRGGALVLLHHLDVVPPGPGWTHAAFSGQESKGSIWGRGALDVKSLGIAHLVAFLEAKREDWPLARDLVFLAVADEEAGGAQGTGWVLERHRDLLGEVAAVLGEGGSNRYVLEKLHWWGVEVAQKRPLWLEVTAFGKGGHGSTLNLHTAPHRLIRGLNRILERPLDYRLTPEVRRYFEAVRPLENPAFQKIVDNLDEIVASAKPSTRLLPGLPNFLLDSFQVNVLEAGEKLNVAPEEATARIDIRLLPDADDEAVLNELKELLGDRVRLEVLLRAPRVEPSPTGTPFYRCLEEVLSPEAPVVPSFIPGVTDSRYFRERGIPAYGFSPFQLSGDEMRGVHGPDERIARRAFQQGVELMTELVRRCAAD